ncbi:chaplin [Streptomyces sp. NPDC001070]
MNSAKKAALIIAAAGAAAAGSAATALADSHAGAVAAGSPGAFSGNVTQVPVNTPVNLCGNTHNFFAALNPAIGNTCANIDGKSHGSYGH